MSTALPSAAEQAPGHGTDWCGLLLAFGLFPLAIVQRSVLPVMFDINLQRVLFWYCLVVLVWGALKRTDRARGAWAFGWPVWGFVAMVGSMQAVAMYASARAWFIPDPAWAGAITWAELAFQIGVLVVQAVTMRLLCWQRGGPGAVLCGAVVSLLGLLAVCAVQLGWLLTRGAPGVVGELGGSLAAAGLVPSAQTGMEPVTGLLHLVQRLHASLTGLLLWFGDWLETHSLITFYPLYAEGSYTMTELRLNGMFDEASTLGSSLALFYVPLLAGLGVLAHNKLHRVLVGCGVAAVLLVLVAARSTTAAAGFVLACVWFGWSAWKSSAVPVAPRKRVRLVVWALCAGLTLGAVFGLVLMVDAPSRRFVTRLFDPATYTLPRQVVTRELLQIFAEHPLLGVGYHWADVGVVNGEQYISAMIERNNPEMQAWRVDMVPLPTLSLLAQTLAEFGGVVVGLMALALCTLRWRLGRWRAAANSAGARFACTSCSAYVLAVSVLSLTSLNWANPLLTLPFFGLWAMVHQAEHPAVANSAPKTAPAPDRAPEQGRHTPPPSPTTACPATPAPPIWYGPSSTPRPAAHSEPPPAPRPEPVHAAEQAEAAAVRRAERQTLLGSEDAS